METYLLLKLSLVHRHGEPVVYTEIPDWLATLQTLIEWINVGRREHLLQIRRCYLFVEKTMTNVVH